jgi:hypothetical protein
MESVAGLSPSASLTGMKMTTLAATLKGIA